MPQQKLTIVPVTLHSDNKIPFSSPAANLSDIRQPKLPLVT